MSGMGIRRFTGGTPASRSADALDLKDVPREEGEIIIVLDSAWEREGNGLTLKGSGAAPGRFGVGSYLLQGL